MVNVLAAIACAFNASCSNVAGISAATTHIRYSSRRIFTTSLSSRLNTATVTFLSLEIGLGAGVASGVGIGAGVGMGVEVGVTVVFTDNVGDGVTTIFAVGVGVDIITSSGVDKDGVGMGSFTYIRGTVYLFEGGVLSDAKLTLMHIPDKNGIIKQKIIKL